MSDDLIKRSDAIDAVMNTEPVFAVDSLEPYQKTKDVVEVLEAIPSADRPQLDKDIVEPIGNGNVIMSEDTYEDLLDRPQGEWIEHKWIEYNEKCMLEMPMHNYECSKCHSIFYEVRETNFCPNCGSRMKGADDE